MFLQEGDILLMKGTRIFSYGIQFLTESEYSHVAIVLRINGGLCLCQSSPNSLKLKDVSGCRPFGGVFASSIHEEIEKRFYSQIDVWRLQSVFEARDDLKTHFFRYHGTPYEEAGIALACAVCKCSVVPTSSFSCGEFVATLLKDVSLLPYERNPYLMVPQDFTKLGGIQKLGRLSLPKNDKKWFFDNSSLPSLTEKEILFLKSFQETSSRRLRQDDPKIQIIEEVLPETPIRNAFLCSTKTKRSGLFRLQSVAAALWCLKILENDAFVALLGVSLSILYVCFARAMYDDFLQRLFLPFQILEFSCKFLLAVSERPIFFWTSVACEIGSIGMMLLIAHLSSLPRVQSFAWSFLFMSSLFSYLGGALFEKHEIVAWASIGSLSLLAAVWQKFLIHSKERSLFNVNLIHYVFFSVVCVGLYLPFLTPELPLKTMQNAFDWSDERGLERSAYTLFENTPGNQTNAYFELVDSLYSRNLKESISLKVQQFSTDFQESFKHTQKVCSYAASRNITCIISAFDSPEREFASFREISLHFPPEKRAFIGICLEADTNDFETQLRRIREVHEMGSVVRWVKGSWYRGNTISSLKWRILTEKYISISEILCHLNPNHIIATQDPLVIRYFTESKSCSEITSFFYSFKSVKRSLSLTNYFAIFYGEGSVSTVSHSNLFLRYLHLKTYGMVVSKSRILEMKSEAKKWLSS